MIEWLHIRQAAQAIGITERSVLRRVAAGKVDSRLDDDGRRVIAVDLPDAVMTPGMTPVGDNLTPGGDADQQDRREGHDANRVGDNQVMTLVGDARQSMQIAVASSQQLAVVAQRQADRYRTSARAAWSLVGVLTVGIVAGVAWSVRDVTTTRIENRVLLNQVKDRKTAVDAVAVERDQIRDQLDRARLDAARTAGEIQGKLTVVEHDLIQARQLIKPATTRPASLLQRLTTIFEPADR